MVEKQKALQRAREQAALHQKLRTLSDESLFSYAAAVIGASFDIFKKANHILSKSTSLDISDSGDDETPYKRTDVIRGLSSSLPCVIAAPLLLFMHQREVDRSHLISQENRNFRK